MSPRASFLLLLAVAACAGGRAPEPPAAVPEPAAKAAAADTARVLVGDYESPHGSRRYRLYVPARTKAAPAPPLFVMLHGCAQTAAELATAGRFDSLGAELGALVLMPEQPASANPLRCWNWFSPAHQGRNAGEPAIIAELARQAAAEHGADSGRIYVGGLSAGGAMAVLAGLAYPDLFAAIGTHSGVGWRVAKDVPGAFAAMRGGGVDPAAQAAEAHQAMGPHARVVPLIAIHGAADSLAHPAASEGLVQQMVSLHRLLSGSGSLDSDTTRIEAGGYPLEIRRYADDTGVVIEHWVVGTLAHALSGGDPAARWTDPQGPDAAREMLEFMLTRRRSGGGGEREEP